MDNQSLDQERSSNCSHQVFNSGCGCNDTSGIIITISPTTGGQFTLEVRKTDSVDHVKKIISKKLKVLRERICLLYRDRQLMNGSLQDNDIGDGCRLTILPTVETGLTTQRPELSVINALESLNESQVNDFLSGKAPLNLTMRLGDHMMLIQLMLSTFSNQSQISLSSNPSKTDVHPSTSSVASHSKNMSSKDSIQPENPTKIPTTIVNDETNVTFISSSRLENMLNSRSKVAFAKTTGAKADLMATENEAVPTQSISTSTTAEDINVNSANLKKSTTSKIPVATTSACSSTSCSYRPNLCTPVPPYGTDSVPLAKATRNLTQTLQKLSSEVLTSKRVVPAHSKYKSGNENVMHYNRKPNAILENMEHHGRGIYSGTFSGTLNPALQDRFGRPKKDVSTIIHILNDLLCAEPRAQYKSSCGCPSTSTLMTDKMKKPSPSVDVTSSSNSFLVPERSVLNNVEEITRFGTATLIPVSVNEQNVNLVSKANENQTTRSKMEQLKSIMVERKEKRKEKRFAPYEKRFSAVNLISSTSTDPWSASNPDAAVPGASTHEPMDSETILSKAAVIA